MTTQREIRPIPGLPDYFAGSDGTIWSSARGPLRQLKQCDHSAGYRVVGVREPGQRHRGGKVKSLYVHRLVLLAFVGPCPLGLEACHGDGDRANNTLPNLRWASPSDNTEDKRRHGTMPVGDSHAGTKLTSSRLAIALQEAAIGRPHKDIAADLGVSRSTITRAVGKHRDSLRAVIAEGGL